jgi:pimeloyl-ACP methyl ester carboxylesterase
MHPAALDDGDGRSGRRGRLSRPAGAFGPDVTAPPGELLWTKHGPPLAAEPAQRSASVQRRTWCLGLRPGEIWAAPRSWVETVYPNLTYFNEVDRGGHFAAWEEPELFSQEVRAAFRSLR